MDIEDIDENANQANEEINIRDSLEKAFADQEAKEQTSEPQKAAKENAATQEKEVVSPNENRDEKGKFVKKTETADTSKEQTQSVNKISAPQSWTSESKAHWDKLPAHLQNEISKREKEVEQGFTKLDEERNFGKSIKEIITPYMPIINAEGGTPATAIQSLLNTAYYLRSNATPQEKGKLIQQLAKQFNADITQNNTTAVQPDQVLAQTQQELAALRQKVEQQPMVLRQQQETESLQRIIDAFSADPKNVHYEKLKPVMASLLQSGQAKDMQEAYDKASWADPDIRSSILADQAKELEAKRIADLKAKTVNARKASVSITGSPGVGEIKSNGSSDLRAQLSDAWDEHAS